MHIGFTLPGTRALSSQHPVCTVILILTFASHPGIRCSPSRGLESSGWPELELRSDNVGSTRLKGALQLLSNRSK